MQVVIQEHRLKSQNSPQQQVAPRNPKQIKKPCLHVSTNAISLSWMISQGGLAIQLALSIDQGDKALPEGILY